MVLICLLLLVAGFFFPPAWLALVGYAIYIYSSRKSRRDDAVEDRIKRMVEANREIAVFGDLYFEAARSYAIAKGAQSPEQDAASTTVIINGRSYFVIFIRDSGGGTEISVRDSHAVENEIRHDLQERLEGHGIESTPGMAINNLNSKNCPSEFADTYLAYLESTGKTNFDKLNQKPSWSNDNDKVKTFTNYSLEASTRSGVAESYAIAFFLQKEFLNLMFSCVASAEAQGFDFNFQKQTGVAIIKLCWDRMSEEKKNVVRKKSLSSEDLEALSNLINR